MATPSWTRRDTLVLSLITAFWIVMAFVRPFGLLPSWVLVMASTILFLAVAGKGIKGVYRGALIDHRNRISLSRLQMLVWTVVVVSAYGTMVAARLGDDPLQALEVGVPQELWWLMGISTTSLVGSPLLLSTKKDPSLTLPDQDMRLQSQGVDPQSTHVEGQVVANNDVAAAGWPDLFTGEEVANVSHLDLAKIQMFFFTVVVVLTYAAAIGKLLSRGEVSQLPPVNQGMVALLGISHAGYLTSKAVPTAKP